MRAINFANPEIGSVLIHALNNVGKTHVMGSALEYEQQFGRCLYAVMNGEPVNTLAQYDLSNTDIIEFESIEDIIRAMNKDRDPFRAIVVDSIQVLGELAQYEVTGGKHAVGADEKDHGREWNKMKYAVNKSLAAFKKNCVLLLATCVSRTHENQITKEVRVVPDVTGMGEVVQGRFNFVGYLEATVVSATRTDRTLSFQRRIDAITRWNAPNPMTKPIGVPQGRHTWEVIRTTLENGLKYDPGQAYHRPDDDNEGVQALSIDGNTSNIAGADNLDAA